MRNRHRYFAFIGGVTTALLVVLSPAADVARAAPATWYVAPSGSDANSCAAPAEPCASINGAIAKASAGDTVRVAVGTYTASDSQVVLVDRSVTLEGGWDTGFSSRSGVSTIDGADSRRGITVNSATTATVDSFVVQNGVPAPGFINGGGVLNSGTLTLRNSRIVDNQANEGAGIWNGGSLVLARTTVRGNQSGSTGGGIHNGLLTTMTISESTIAGNTAMVRGGGIYFYEATVNVRNSTVSGNTAEWEGGGIYLSGNDAVLEASSSTIAANRAELYPGGGIYVGGGVGSTVTLRNTILGDNSARDAPDCSAGFVTPVTSAGFNLVENTAGCFFGGTASDLTGVDPLLGPLEDNGGPTRTHALLANSLANDDANPAGCADHVGTLLTTDQRGVERPLGAACDIGAFEAEPPPNDDFEDRVVLDGLTAPLTDTNAFGTKEAGEPDHAVNEGGSSIWYGWSPTFTGTAYVSTVGSDFDTLLGVYAGTEVSSLATLAANDDATVPAGPSKACFPAAAGTTYRIAVDGFDAALGGTDGEGSVRLTWGQYTSSDPCAVLPPTITGTPVAGGTLAATTGTWAGTPSGFAYQWFACDPDGCFGIGGATGSTYTPPGDAVGYRLFVRVIAKHPSDNSRDAIGYSALTAPVAAAPPTPPAIPLTDLKLTGSVEPASARVGQTLAWRLRVESVSGDSPVGAFVAVDLPQRVTLVSAMTDRGACDSTGTLSLRCNLDYLASGSPVGNVTLVTTAGQPGEHVLTAIAAHRGVDPRPGDNIVTLMANTPAALKKPKACKGVTRIGTRGPNRLVGTSCADRLRGMRGNDRLVGLGGADALYGGAGEDVLNGGAGRDVLDGGPGADSILARDRARDTIRCGPDSDVVVADRIDRVARSCERVTRR